MTSFELNYLISQETHLSFHKLELFGLEIGCEMDSGNGSNYTVCSTQLRGQKG